MSKRKRAPPNSNFNQKSNLAGRRRFASFTCHFPYIKHASYPLAIFMRLPLRNKLPGRSLTLSEASTSFQGFMRRSDLGCVKAVVCVETKGAVTHPRECSRVGVSKAINLGLLSMHPSFSSSAVSIPILTPA